MLKFLAALALLLLGLFLQVFLASVGLYFDLALALLIAFAFLFEFLDLIFYILLTVFLLNWKPALSLALLLLAAIPLGAYIFRKVTRFHAPVSLAAMTIVGFLIFYLANAPTFFLSGLGHFLADLVVGLAIGEATYAMVQFRR